MTFNRTATANRVTRVLTYLMFFGTFVLFEGNFEEKSLCNIKHVKVIGLDLTHPSDHTK